MHMLFTKIKKNKIFPYVISIGLVGATTLLGEYIKTRLEPTNIGMLYLLAVVITALYWGQGPAIITAILGVFCFDFFLIPPYLTLSVAHIQYVFTLIGFLTVGLVISTLTARMQQHTLERQKEQLQSALLNSISHDLRTPLASITGSLTALLDNYSYLNDTDRTQLLKIATEESSQLNQIVGNLLDMTKMSSGVLKINRNPCELRDLLGTTLEQLKGKTVDRFILIDIPENFPEIPVDFLLMLKVLSNLIDNAVKYSLPETAIHIKARVNNANAIIEIADQGSGIIAHDLPHIFEKFYRAEQHQSISGTGLGLSICKCIVEAHKGTITAKNNGEKGTLFTITIPLYEIL